MSIGRNKMSIGRNKMSIGRNRSKKSPFLIPLRLFSKQATTNKFNV
jgi:hypothetical protein